MSKNFAEKNFETVVGNDNEPILRYISKFKNHPSIKATKCRKKEEQTFNFNYVSYEEVLNKVTKLHTPKTIQQNDIPTKISDICYTFEVFARHFHESIIFSMENSIFPSENPVLK